MLTYLNPLSLSSNLPLHLVGIADVVSLSCLASGIDSATSVSSAAVRGSIAESSTAWTSFAAKLISGISCWQGLEHSACSVPSRSAIGRSSSCRFLIRSS